jgi:putative RNA 2'-phosphotransferase
VDNERLVKASKYLSKHLRHQPERLGLVVAPGGWVHVDALLAACRRNNFPLTAAELGEVVERNDKKRFAFDESGQLIRANQGHSIDVDLQLAVAAPPAALYHGTGQRAVDAILCEGLLRMRRHHVHLSRDIETARRVGARHGKPVVLLVDAAAMAADGHAFYRAGNDVWLADAVPPCYLNVVDER